MSPASHDYSGSQYPISFNCVPRTMEPAVNSGIMEAKRGCPVDGRRAKGAVLVGDTRR